MRFEQNWRGAHFSTDLQHFCYYANWPEEVGVGVHNNSRSEEQDDGKDSVLIGPEADTVISYEFHTKQI